MYKLTPPQILERLKQICKEYYNVTDEELFTVSQGDRGNIIDCRYALMVAGTLTTIYSGLYMLEYCGYNKKRGISIITERYHLDEKFAKQVNEIISKL